MSNLKDRLTPEQKQILKDIDQEKLQTLLEDEGITLEESYEMAFRSIVPAICCTPGCDATYQMEPDQNAGACEECGFKNVKSILILNDIL